VCALAVLAGFIITFSMVNYAYGHETDEFKHAKGDVVGIIKSDPQDPRCPLMLMWELEDGREYCVVLTDHGLHLKLLGGTGI
jgi:hypothetical protein